MAGTNEIWIIDAEWRFRAGRIDQESAWEPVILCAVGLHSGRRLSFMGRGHDLHAFFREHADDMFVAHYAVAEMKFMLRVGLPLPARWFDTFVAWRYLSNGPGNLNAGLAHALVDLGLPGLAPPEKTVLRQKILHLQYDATESGQRQEIIDYCYSDCDGCACVFFRFLQERISAAVMAHWVEYLKAVASMELRGIPFDIKSYRHIQSIRPEIKAAMIGSVNATWHVFDSDKSSRPAKYTARGGGG